MSDSLGTRNRGRSIGLVGLILIAGIGLFAWLDAEGQHKDALAGLEHEAATESEPQRADLTAPTDLVAEESPNKESREVITLAEEESSRLSNGQLRVRVRVQDKATGLPVSDHGFFMYCGPLRLVQDRMTPSWFSHEGFVNAPRGDRDTYTVAELEYDIFVQEGISDANGVVEFATLNVENHHTVALRANGLEGWRVPGYPRVITNEELQSPGGILVEVERWPPPPGGDISGILRPEHGRFPAFASPDLDQLVVEMCSVEKPYVTRQAELIRDVDTLGNSIVNFRFHNVPDMLFDVRVSSSGSYSWSPASVQVAPPQAALEFVRLSESDHLPIEFEVVDAQTGKAISDYEVRRIHHGMWEDSYSLLTLRPLEGEQLRIDEEFYWTVYADDYAVAYGDQDDVHRQTDRMFVRVELKRGSNAMFIVSGQPRGEDRKPLFGVDIIVDGTFAGTTDQNGVFYHASERTPASVDFRYQDWTLQYPTRPWHNGPTLVPALMVEPARN